METPCPKIDAKEGDKDRKKANDHHISGFPTPPPDGKSVMNQDCVHDPCYEGPCFLGIPIPVGSPGYAGPEGPGDNADGKKREAVRHTPIIY